jgi:DNA-binding CsgD family transcriptional regulator
MTRAEAIHQAIHRVYGAALAPDDWPQTLALMADVVGAHKAMLNAETAGASGMVFSVGIESACALQLRREFEIRLPDWIKSIPVGTALRQSSAISDGDFRRSDIYNEAVRPAGGFYGLVAPLVRCAGRQVHFSAGRDLGAVDFSDADLEAAKLLVPHLTRALEVQDRLAAAELRTRGAYEVMAQLNVGVILFDTAMRPVFVNPCAEALASRGDGLLLTCRAILASRHADMQDLHRAMAAALGWHDASRDGSEVAIRSRAPMRCTLARRPPRPPLAVSVMPLCATGILGEWHAAARAVLFVMEPDRPSGLESVILIKSFGLTPREAALATLLARGIDLSDAASRLGIGIGTARGYLKQVLAKTGTHRQAELVSLLLRSGLHVAE